jgi:predicted GIY-YIG superfamily endonuclease
LRRACPLQLIAQNWDNCGTADSRCARKRVVYPFRFEPRASRQARRYDGEGQLCAANSQEGHRVIADNVPRVPSEAKPISATEVNSLAPGSYVYFLSLDDECVYVGSTRNLKNRLPLHRYCNGPFDSVHYLSVPVGDRLFLERRWKFTLRPRYNTDCHKSVIDVPIGSLPIEALQLNILIDAPAIPCVYFLSRHGRAFYVGRAKKLRARLHSHKSQGRLFDGVHFIPCAPSRMISLEKEMRLRFGPRFDGNTSLVPGRESKTIRLMPDGSRAPQIHVSVTPDQRDAWKAAAAVEGMGMSAWIRKTLDTVAKRKKR